MKTQKELKVIKEELENLNKKLSELSEDELQQVVGCVQISWKYDGSRPTGIDL